MWIPGREQMAERFLAACNVSFDGAEWPVKVSGDFVVRQSLLVAQMQRELLSAEKLPIQSGHAQQTPCAFGPDDFLDRRNSREWS